MGTRTFTAVWEHRWYNCPPVCESPTWQPCRRANGDLLQEDATRHPPPSQDCSWQSLCLRSRSLLTHASSGDPRTLKGGSGSVSCGGHRFFPSVLAHSVLFVPSKCLWQLQGLILNVIVTLLPSYCSYHFALGHPTWASGIGTEYPQAIWLWRSAGFDYRTSTGLGKQRHWEGTTKPCVHEDPGETNSDPYKRWARLACVCLGGAGGGVGQQWPAMGSTALTTTVLRGQVCWQKSFRRR